jgi:hypothetical protein
VMTLSRRATRCLTLIVVSIIGLAGCGTDGPKVYPAKGKLTYKGQPLAAAGVTFHPTSNGSLAAAQTNTQGEFQLTTFTPSDGAIAGDYVVTVVKSEGGAAGAEVPTPTANVDISTVKKSADSISEKTKGGGAKQMMTQMTAVKQLLPVKYSNRETSPIKVTVKPDPIANDFTLTVED